MLAPLDFAFANPRGFFVIDGVNGAGKSTVVKLLQQRIAERGITTHFTREPGGTSLGAELRKLLLTSQEPLPPMAELFLFAADRATHVATKITPALARGEFVISDRYHYSTTAFQGYGRGLDLATIESVNEIACQGLTPDGVLLLDLPPEIGLRRTARRESEQDNFESEELAFHERIRSGFLALARERKEPFFVIDADASPQDVGNRCWSVIERWMNSLLLGKK